MSKPKMRQKARRLLVQALYSWDVGGTDLITIEAEFHVDNNMATVDKELFHDVLFGVPKNLREIDAAYELYLDREQEQLDPVSRAILRLSTYEMIHRIDVPYKVVINEGVNLAKTFGPTDAFKFVNGILDQVAIAKRAIKRKTGARGLRSIMEDILLDTMFELPGLETVEEVVVNREVAEGRAQPLFIYGERAAEQSSA